MKILAVADIHGSQYRLNLVLKNVKAYSPDLVVLCGDITQFGPGELATNFLNQIPVKTFAIPGNIDTFDVDQGIIASNAIYLHLKRVVIQGIPFVGIGREIPSPLTDITIINDGEKKSLMNVLDKTSVLVTHVPPFKLQDKIFIGSHGGSKKLRNLIDTCKPRFVLCGHIHEDPGVTQLMNMTVVNCSLGKRTEGAIVEINDTIKVTILD
ncbi:3',5'-cyclic adenosine monophosphate phosphodiesterase CpdA [uncultured archaeon]|nr:3',5'-cyclic adenosine monophosphate phosphodiesterase CpdA [uncultured archaeon]